MRNWILPNSLYLRVSILLKYVFNFNKTPDSLLPMRNVLRLVELVDIHIHTAFALLNYNWMVTISLYLCISMLLNFDISSIVTEPSSLFFNGSWLKVCYSVDMHIHIAAILLMRNWIIPNSLYLRGSILLVIDVFNFNKTPDSLLPMRNALRFVELVDMHIHTVSALLLRDWMVI